VPETLSIFFPMWNEEAYIDRAVGLAKDVCEELVAAGDIGDYELIVVDDASTDHTGKIADEMAAADRHVKVVHHPVNRKLGGSIKTGFATATGDLVLYSDADLPFDMAELHKAVRLLRVYEADIVSAYRFDRVGEGPSRAIYTFFYNVLIRRLFGVRMRDINFAFKLCRRRIFEHVELASEGSFIDAELIIRARKLGFHVIQFGVDYFPRTRGDSTLSSIAVIRRIVAEMFQLRRELRGLSPVQRGLG
jgi:glycosyltransferase involved in cell wall biosynthesis